ncbi:MAG: glycogen synthase GlgA [Acidobacteria bacterium]|nr:glycogen synthase GlgA [Acidobacteriota bacterium]
MNVLSVAPECYPLVKTGGLADVVGALPPALTPLGVRMRVLMPGYPGVRQRLRKVREVATVPDLFGGDGALLQGVTPDGTEVLLLQAAHLYDRAGGPYLGPDGRDWPDNHLRFGALSWTAAEVALGRLGDWQPDVVHLHDWQSALTAAYLRFGSGSQPAPPTLLTIHNLAFQGLFPMETRKALRLPVAAAGVDGMEYWGNLSFLKAGVLWGTHLSTVSPTYAREILGPEEGMGFDGLLRQRSHELTGIVNGIDTEVWDPATDPAVTVPYSVRRLAPRRRNTAALRTRLGLQRSDGPLFAVVSRLTHQKGLDLLLQVLPHLVGSGGQLAVLGSGDPALEHGFAQAALEYPGRVAAVIGFDETLSHQMQAGADAVLVPSRFEPCGLTQLYGLRYGAVPVVARVGGLADTVVDANESAVRDGVATGVQFSPVDAPSLADAVTRTIGLFHQPDVWKAIQRRAMTRDVGWATPAAQYRSLYDRLVASHKG